MLQDVGSDFELLGELTAIQVIAVHVSIRERRQLRDQFSDRRWRKLKGVCRVRFPNGAVRLAEVHRYETRGVGRRKGCLCRCTAVQREGTEVQRAGS